MDEFGLIARYFAPIAAAEPGALGLKDDAAVLALTPGARLVATTDALVAGVHFFADDPPGDIARKLMRVNLSDLAAMGATPRAVLVAAVLPRDTDDAWLMAFAEGLADDARRFGAPLVGGDTVATDGPLTLSLTALGEARGEVLTRSGAAAGDDVYVSGTIGDAALGLLALKDDLGFDDAVSTPLAARYLVPEPRLALGQALAEGGGASACIDVSDGLIADLGHICECSRLGAEIAAAAVPLSDAAREVVAERPELLGTMLTGGDDYELCFTAPVTARARIEALASDAGISVVRIGTMRAGASEVVVTDDDEFGIVIESGGFRHF